jgi:hypothetical protein
MIGVPEVGYLRFMYPNNGSSLLTSDKSDTGAWRAGLACHLSNLLTIWARAAIGKYLAKER